MNRFITLFCCLLSFASGGCVDAPAAKGPRPEHHTDSGFRNLPDWPKSTMTTLQRMGFFWKMINKNTEVEFPADYAFTASQALKGFEAHKGKDAATWLGHAAFLFRLGETVILTDPWLSDRASPVGFTGPRRWAPKPIDADNLPKFDVLLITHNHYDHLDVDTLKTLPKNVPVLTGLKVGKIIRSLGFTDVRELDWHDSVRIGEINYTYLPAVHFSARSPFDRNDTLWGSFLIEGPGKRVYFMGDTAYHEPLFTELGRRYGPVDLAIVGIGAFEPRELMQGSHTRPEEAVRLAGDLGAKSIAWMHWGTVLLGLDSAFEPRDRFLPAARAAGYAGERLLDLKIGETRPIP